MCFSAGASFIAGGVLSTAGVATLKKTKKASEVPLAATPFLFGIQQITEGFVWVALQQNLVMLSQVASFIFSLFAYALWPAYIPFAVLLLENNPIRRRIILPLFILGLGVTGYLLYYIVLYPVSCQIVENSIHYAESVPYGMNLFWLYVLAGAASCFASSHKLIRVFGLLLIASICVAYYFHAFTFVSVWCFFAAILSLVIYLFFKERNAQK